MKRIKLGGGKLRRDDCENFRTTWNFITFVLDFLSCEVYSASWWRFVDVCDFNIISCFFFFFAFSWHRMYEWKWKFPNVTSIATVYTFYHRTKLSFPTWKFSQQASQSTGYELICDFLILCFMKFHLFIYDDGFFFLTTNFYISANISKIINYKAMACRTECVYGFGMG